MQGTHLLGITSRADTTLQQGEKHFKIFQAAGSISVGMLVGLASSNTFGRKVVAVTASASTDHEFLGIYTGVGGKGSATATSGLSGNDAVTNDVIYVQTYGLCRGLVAAHSAAVTTNVADLDTLTPATVAGQGGWVFKSPTAVTQGLVAPLTAMEAVTLNASTTISAPTVFLRCPG